LLKKGYAISDFSVYNRGSSIIFDLRIETDKLTPVNVKDCVDISRFVSVLLEVENVGKHVLEVGSPGPNRRLRFKKDFVRFLEKKAKIETKNLISGQRRFKGILTEVNGETLKIKTDENEFIIPIDEIEKS
jgi:ribosome maturation factor RimP